MNVIMTVERNAHLNARYTGAKPVKHAPVSSPVLQEENDHSTRNTVSFNDLEKVAMGPGA